MAVCYYLRFVFISCQKEMSLSICPDDVLLRVASYIYSNLHPTCYYVDFEQRRYHFRNLVLVCRRFNAVFTRLLYRTLCLVHERNDWPFQYQEQWSRLNPDRRLTACFLRILRTALVLRHYIHFLELSYDTHDGAKQCSNLYGISID